MKIPIYGNFCNINNINDMSPTFLNRFNVIVLENQLEKLNDYQLSELISNFFISFAIIPQKQKKENINHHEKNEIILIEEDNKEENEEENEEIEKINDYTNQNNLKLNKEDVLKKRIKFIK